MRFLYLIGLSILLSACTVKIKTSIKENVEKPEVSVPAQEEKKVVSVQEKKTEKKPVSVSQKKVEEPAVLVVQKEEIKEPEVLIPSEKLEEQNDFQAEVLPLEDK